MNPTYNLGAIRRTLRDALNYIDGNDNLRNRILSAIEGTKAMELDNGTQTENDHERVTRTGKAAIICSRISHDIGCGFLDFGDCETPCACNRRQLVADVHAAFAAATPETTCPRCYTCPKHRPEAK